MCFQFVANKFSLTLTLPLPLPLSLSHSVPLWAYLLPHKIEKSIELHLYNIWLNSFCLLPQPPAPSQLVERALRFVFPFVVPRMGGRGRGGWRVGGGMDCGWVLWAGPLTVCGHCVCLSVHLFVCLLVCLSVCLPWPALYICGFHGVSSSCSVPLSHSRRNRYENSLVALVFRPCRVLDKYF